MRESLDEIGKLLSSAHEIAIKHGESSIAEEIMHSLISVDHEAMQEEDFYGE